MLIELMLELDKSKRLNPGRHTTATKFGLNFGLRLEFETLDPGISSDFEISSMVYECRYLCMYSSNMHPL